MFKRITHLIFIVLVGAIALGTTPGFAEWPERPITMLIPFAAGGGTDFNGRLTAAVLEKDLGVQVRCVNRTGGSGVVGHKAIADAKPDGYTIGYVVVELSMMHWAGLTDLDYRNFTSLGQLSSVGGGIFVQASSPYNSAADVIKAIKANPGKLKASGSGLGGIWHLAMAGMLESEGLKADDVIWVPNQGAAPSMQDLAAGGLDFVVCAPGEAKAMTDAGKTRGLAYLGAKRNAILPDMPTLKEAVGSDWTLDAWGGVAAPKGLPKDIEKKLGEAVKRVSEDEGFKATFKKRGKPVAYKNPDEFEKFMAEMDKNFGQVMKAVGLAK